MSDHNPMDKVIDNLWIGTHLAALDADLLHKNGINSILTVMRGKLAIQKVRVSLSNGKTIIYLCCICSHFRGGKFFWMIQKMQMR